jgi:DNA polymerase III alpha subunit (gram-positive type)
MQKSNYIVFDCETGGLDENKNPITQYAAMVLDGKTLKEIDRWETFVKPYGDLIIEQDALDRTMVTMSEINSGLSSKEFAAVMEDFWENHRVKTRNREMGRLIPVGHNVQFDIRFINWVLDFEKKRDMFEWHHPNFIDTFSLAKLAFGIKGEEKLNLGASCQHAKIKLTDAHGAMNDVEATADLLRWFMKKLRDKKGAVKEETNSGRPKGDEFFEFKCVAK